MRQSGCLAQVHVCFLYSYIRLISPGTSPHQLSITAPLPKPRMALLVALCSLAACREGWKSLGSRCVYQTAGQWAESACAADCASVVRPWIANDTGGVPMCIRSQGEHDFLHTWVGREYWTGFRRNGASDGVRPPDDWRTGLVHPQGSACSASANPWFDSLMRHQGAWPLLERARRCTQRLSVRRVCALPSWKPIRSGA